jgi:hypothetical protein
MSEVNISDIREVLRNLVDGTRFTFAQVARETGCQPAWSVAS